MPCEAWQHVVQLCQFDLQLAFSGARVARKNVEDQLGAIDDSSLDDLFNIALLGRTEIVVEQENVGIHGGCGAGYFFKFACADQGRWIWPVASLQDLAHNIGPGTLRKSTQLCQGLVGIELGNARFGGRLGGTPGNRCGFACGGRLSCDNALHAGSSTGTDVESYQERALAFCSVTNDLGSEGHTPAGTRPAARFLGMRTYQSGNALSFGARSAGRRHCIRRSRRRFFGMRHVRDMR